MSISSLVMSHDQLRHRLKLNWSNSGYVKRLITIKIHDIDTVIYIIDSIVVVGNKFSVLNETTV